MAYRLRGSREVEDGNQGEGHYNVSGLQDLQSGKARLTQVAFLVGASQGTREAFLGADRLACQEGIREGVEHMP